jgi:hypothetical protein
MLSIITLHQILSLLLLLLLLLLPSLQSESSSPHYCVHR